MFSIPEGNLGALIAKLEKLNDKAVKLGCGSVSWTVGDSQFVKVDGKTIAVYNVEVVGQEPVIDGWRFVAKVEHLESGNVIRNLSEKSLPVEFRDSSFERCDHCHTKRQRNFTFVIVKDGEYKQVGSTCLKDFLGHGDPLAIAELAENIANIEHVVSEFYYDENTTSDYVELSEYMSYVAMSVRLHGWESRSKAIGVPTADMAMLAMYPGKYTEKVYPTEQDCKEATATIDYIRNVEDNGEYFHNLSVIFSQDYISIRNHLGYAASAIIAYQKYVEQKARVDSSKSEYQGEIKKRQEWTLTVTRIFSYESAYGVCHTTLMQDDAGNEFVWKTGKALEQGQTYTGKATVKEHKEYRGIKQTVLTCCKLTIEEK
jgi:hypothetical protein